MLYTNAKIFTPGGYVSGGFRVESGVFTEILPGCSAEEGLDLGGAKVLPGLVDIHIHGAAGADVSDGDPDGVRAMSGYLAAAGVTAFLPTVMTLPPEDAARALHAVHRARLAPAGRGARILGARLEGPFLSPERCGAQNSAWLRAPDVEPFYRLWEGCGGEIRMVDLAPELPEALSFIRRTGALCRLSLGHSAADYDTAAAAFDAGASHVTHLFNAMPPLHHRAPGLIGAAAERKGVTAELICDGVHVHPSAVRLAFRLFRERLCLVSDALRCCGRPEGEYELTGRRVTLRGGAAWLDDGTLAGAAMNLFDAMRNAVRFGVEEETAIRAATLLPARIAGCGDRLGSVEPGKGADFLVCGEDLTLRAVYLAGKRIR